MENHIIFVHGRKPKPALEDLRDLWYEAIRFGLRSDHGVDAVEAFERATRSFVYYGDLSNETLIEDASFRAQEMRRIAAQRRLTLEALKTRDRRHFEKPKYKKIRQFRDAFMQAFNYVVLKKAELLGKNAEVAERIGSEWADLESLWSRKGAFDAGVRARAGNALEAALSAGDRVLVVAHSLGTMIVYDALWELSWGTRAQAANGNEVDTWITLGSPLGAGVVKEKLNGWNETGERKYPANVYRWLNFTAEDDDVASDQDLCDDFDGMSHHHGTRIEDREIYSLALRDGRAHPHSSVGYLVHPEVVGAIGRWLGVG